MVEYLQGGVETSICCLKYGGGEDRMVMITVMVVDVHTVLGAEEGDRRNSRSGPSPLKGR